MLTDEHKIARYDHAVESLMRQAELRAEYINKDAECEDIQDNHLQFGILSEAIEILNTLWIHASMGVKKDKKNEAFIVEHVTIEGKTVYERKEEEKRDDT